MDDQKLENKMVEDNQAAVEEVVEAPVQAPAPGKSIAQEFDEIESLVTNATLNSVEKNKIMKKIEEVKKQVWQCLSTGASPS